MDVVLMGSLGANSVTLPGYHNPKTDKVEFQHPAQEEIDAMETDFLCHSISLWVTSKRWGLPNGHWNDERSTVIDIINILESESNRYDAWAMKHRDDIPEDEDE